jgi:hypothetical protein|tara:strand:- start:530 stop:793 length:264 start_codon:yes stop_codon:yes gene_type:complete
MKDREKTTLRQTKKRRLEMYHAGQERENMNTKWNTVEVYSISKDEVITENTSRLALRTPEPVSLSEGLRVCAEYEQMGHVVELRKTS